MTLVLYDLAGAEDERRFSPFCWRTKLALAHKGLAVETRPWRFTEKEAIAFSGQGLVPVLVDDGRVVADSWAIANYLEETYPDRPSLFAGPGGRALTLFVARWVDTALHPSIFRLVALDIHRHAHEMDRDYFRDSREKRFGTTLEALAGDPEARLAELRERLLPLRLMLKAQPFLGGETPLYADYVAFAAFQWARAVSPLALLAADDPVAAWRERLLDAFDGLARNAVGYPCVAA